MAVKHCGLYTDKVNPVSARNEGFYFRGDGTAVKLEPDPEPTQVSKSFVDDIDLAELEAWLHGDAGLDDPEPEPEPEHQLTMPAAKFVKERPTFVDVLRARLPGGVDKVYKPKSERPTFADFLRRQR